MEKERIVSWVQGFRESLDRDLGWALPLRRAAKADGRDQMEHRKPLNPTPGHSLFCASFSQYGMLALILGVLLVTLTKIFLTGF